MRTAVLGLLFIILSSTALFSSDEQLDQWLAIAHSHAVRFAFEKEVEIRGLNRLTSSEVAPLVPMERSVAWWLGNPAEVAAAVARHPLIQKASVERCSDLSLRCFTIDVVEREIAFLARNKDRAWAVGFDGSFLAPVPIEKASSGEISIFGKRFTAAPVVDGLFSDEVSADLIRSRARYVRGALSDIEDSVKLRVKDAALRPDGELEVRFHDVPFTARFANADQDRSILTDEVSRLEVVLKELGGHLDRVKNIDLALNKMAVVEVDGMAEMKASPKLGKLTGEPGARDAAARKGGGTPGSMRSSSAHSAPLRSGAAARH